MAFILWNGLRMENWWKQYLDWSPKTQCSMWSLMSDEGWATLLKSSSFSMKPTSDDFMVTWPYRFLYNSRSWFPVVFSMEALIASQGFPDPAPYKCKSVWPDFIFGDQPKLAQSCHLMEHLYIIEKIGTFSLRGIYSALPASRLIKSIIDECEGSVASWENDYRCCVSFSALPVQYRGEGIGIV